MSAPGTGSSADWSRHAIWWHVYPLGFTGAYPPRPGEPGRGLTQLHGWLDYLLELGANGLALGPVFASAGHGYDTTDHFAIDPRLGTEDDLRALVEACHARGVRVLLDGVFNHAGPQFGPLREVRERGEASPHSRWFRGSRRPDGSWELATFEGHDQLVALNHDAPEVVDYVAGVMEHWLARGVDGWRLDAAYAVPTRFWRAVTDRVRARFPQAWLVGEVIHGDYPAMVTEGGLDSVTQYELWKALWSSLNDGNFFELAWALDRHAALLPTFLPQTFVGNHDVTRIASRLAEPRHLALALLVLMTVGGVPSIYAGDEQAFRGVKEDRFGGDDAVRPPFPPTPDGLAAAGWPVYHLHQRMIALRRRHPWLVAAAPEVTQLANEQLVYRVTGGGEMLLVALNAAATPAQVPLPAGGSPVHWQVEDAEEPAPTPAQGQLALPPHGWAVLRAPAEIR